MFGAPGGIRTPDLPEIKEFFLVFYNPLKVLKIHDFSKKFFKVILSYKKLSREKVGKIFVNLFVIKMISYP